MNNTPLIFWIVPLASLVALGFAWYFFRAMMRCSEGTDRMKEIAAHVRQGAMAYLRQQYKVVTVVFLILALFFAFLAYGLGVQNPWVPFAFLTGGFFSGLAGFFGMKTATYASARTAHAAQQSLDRGLRVAFRSGAVMGLVVVGLGLLDISLWYIVLNCFVDASGAQKLVIITTGSQGEPLSALSRMASCSHRQVRVGPGDFIIISAKPIPGNEKSVTKIVNGLLLLGAEVIYEGMYDVHVSGHACQEEQKLMLTLTRPKYFLPVHGEYKQLKKHAITAASLGIPTSNILIAENGSNIILSQDEMKLGEPVTAGAVMVDGLGVGDVGNVVLRDRKHLSEDGLVIIVATVDSKTGKVLAGPDLVSRGFVYVRENESLMDGAQSIVETALDRCVDEHVRDWNSVKTRVREALSSYIYRRTKRSPMILPILMEV